MDEGPCHQVNGERRCAHSPRKQKGIRLRSRKITAGSAGARLQLIPHSNVQARYAAIGYFCKISKASIDGRISRSRSLGGVDRELTEREAVVFNNFKGT